ncbi:hypothetical protein BJ742DRAFT_834958 [Cladochytrium replicatum]|nr:hypothetical protein BJ742DRAFT_834958 [Cladochytrium replicatum]
MPSCESDPTVNVLALGDGNFSFSLALAKLLWNSPHSLSARSPAHDYLSLHSPDPAKVHVIATSFEPTEHALAVKYPEVREILPAIRKFSPNATVLHGINAWELDKYDFALCDGETKFDIIYWNHPHLGTEDFRLHRFLMAHFFRSAADILKKPSSASPLLPVPCICISVVHGQAERWDLVREAARANLRLESRTPFQEELFPGYVCKRNKTGHSFKNAATKRHTKSEMPSWLFRFVWDESDGSNHGDAAVEAENGSSHNDVASPQPNPPVDTAESISQPSPSPSVASLSIKPPQLPQQRRNRTKLPDAKGDFPCEHCGKRLTSVRAHTQHVHTVHKLQLYGPTWRPDAPRSLQCSHPGCARTFKTEADKHQHEVNRHSVVEDSEVPDVARDVARIVGEEEDAGGEEEYGYVPCGVCGQSVVKRDWGMLLHLESLKPAVGLEMRCPKCSREEGGRERTFCERRALFQHYKFCRLREQLAV